jgi:hypothetical protein
MYRRIVQNALREAAREMDIATSALQVAENIPDAMADTPFFVDDVLFGYLDYYADLLGARSEREEPSLELNIEHDRLENWLVRLGYERDRDLLPRLPPPPSALLPGQH